jgi:signal peptidase I
VVSNSVSPSCKRPVPIGKFAVTSHPVSSPIMAGFAQLWLSVFKGVYMAHSVSKPSATSGDKPNQPQLTVWQEIVAFFKTLIVIFAIAFSLRVTVVEPFKIPSGSMIPTLQIGDFILVLKFWYGLRLPFVSDSAAMWNQPKRGDVVVFTRPDDPNTPDEDDSEIHIIKRVVGLGGESVEVRGAKVIVNGAVLDEPYAQWTDGGKIEGNFGPYTVPPGHVLLLGDNRDNSKDSRFWTNPFLDVKRIKGKAVVVFWSWDSLSRVFTAIR